MWIIIHLFLLDTTQFEVLATLEDVLSALRAVLALKLQHNLLGGLDLLVEDGLGLTSETGLLTVVTSLTLGSQTGLTGLLLPSDGMKSVLLAALAESTLLLGKVNHGVL